MTYFLTHKFHSFKDWHLSSTPKQLMSQCQIHFLHLWSIPPEEDNVSTYTFWLLSKYQNISFKLTLVLMVCVYACYLWCEKLIINIFGNCLPKISSPSMQVKILVGKSKFKRQTDIMVKEVIILRLQKWKTV